MFFFLFSKPVQREMRAYCCVNESDVTEIKCSDVVIFVAAGAKPTFTFGPALRFYVCKQKHQLLVCGEAVAYAAFTVSPVTKSAWTEPWRILEVVCDVFRMTEV